MIFADKYGAGSLLGSSSILTRVEVETTSCLRLCRVCSRPIVLGERRRYRPSFSEYAHEACGWFRPDERGFHERRRPGSDMSILEWRCPSCLLDAADFREPLSIELRCRRCRIHSGPIACGDVVRVIAVCMGHSRSLGCLRRVEDAWDRGWVYITCGVKDPHETALVVMHEGPMRGDAVSFPTSVLVRA